MYKPILFNTEMIQNKVMKMDEFPTRRPIKPQPHCYGPNMRYYHEPEPSDFFLSEECGCLRCRRCGHDPEYSAEGKMTSHLWLPQFKRGDILWVRETFTVDKVDGQTKYYYMADNRQMLEDSCDLRWHPSIHMPKAAARFFLLVTDVRAERLQDITEEDANSEGVGDPYEYQLPDYYEQSHMRGIEYFTSAFAGMWDNLYPDFLWAANPWVWVYSLKKTEKPAGWPNVK